jgi:hypothetical protein
MDSNPARVFISYRRDDAAGYAGRLEEDLERRLGRGKVFRDVQDIPPGEDFAATIRKRLADAHTVLVLIGPRWAGGEVPGQRRIDDERDFVRLEVQVALESGAQVVPLLLPGATMPTEDVLPEPLKELARRNALPIGDPNWDADIARLVASFGLPPRRLLWPWAAGGAAVVAAVVAAVFTLQFGPAADPGDRLLGHWRAEVRYDWGDRHTERFEFKRHAGVITGTAGFLDYPRAIEKLQFDGTNLRFETHSQETMGDSTRELTHAYAAELRGKPPNDLLAFRLLTTGGFSSHKPVEFEARRSAPEDAASAPARP